MNLALFDFDGTVTARDTFSGFLRFAVPRHRMVLGAIALSPVVCGYRLGLLSARQTRPLVSRVGFQGESADWIRHLGRRYAVEELPKVVRTEAVERIQWHQAQGDTVAIVSASLDAYLGPWCDSMGVERICTELEEHGGRLTGRYSQGDCSGQTKVSRIHERFTVSRYDVIYAYGDTSDDREMLELASRKFYRWREINDWSDAIAQGIEHPKGA